MDRDEAKFFQLDHEDDGAESVCPFGWWAIALAFALSLLLIALCAYCEA